jgi:HYR domain
MQPRLIQRLVALGGMAFMALALAGVSGAVTPPTTGTFLHIQSEPGDPIGRGEELLYTPENAGFTMWYVNGYFEARIQGTDGNFWTVHMEAPDGLELVPGTTYSNLTLWPFNGSGGYGLSVSGFASSCSSLGAGSEMTVNELKLRPVFPNEIEKFDATFVQYCNSATAPLRGHIHFETPLDTTAPVLYVPSDLNVEAEDTSGAYVYYGAYAIDDRDGYINPTCLPSAGSLFPVGVSTVNCTAVDSAGNQAEAHFSVTVDPPFQLRLTVAGFGTASTKTGLATATGTVGCNRAATVYLTATVSQVVAGRATIQGSSQVAVNCVAPSVTWTAQVTSSNGGFLPGKATVDASVFVCPYYCHNASDSRVVTLRGM